MQYFAQHFSAPLTKTTTCCIINTQMFCGFIIHKLIDFVNIKTQIFCVFSGGDHMTFGAKLKQCRKEKGLTQAALAKAVGLGTNTIINYERGKTYPQNRNTYRILAQVLDTSVDYLYNEDDGFVVAAAEKYGYRGKQQANALLHQFKGLFAGGELSEEEMDGVMRTLQDFYWKAKDENKKYAAKAKNGENKHG